VTRASLAALALLAVAAPARAQETGPLRLLVQGDVGVMTHAAPLQDPEDPPSGTVARLRRVRAGEELTGHDLHALILLEAQPDTATGVPYPGLAGGQLPFGGPVRVTETFIGWAPSRAFELDAGSLRVPFSLSRQLDEANLPMLERPAFIDAYTPDFRTGASIGGDLGELLYSAAILSADQAIDGHLFGRGYIAAGRIVAEPIGPVGLTPWRRGPDDPWFGWFRFAAGVSVLYGTLAAPQTLAVDPEFTAQWRHLVMSAEYLLSMRVASGASFHDTGAQGVTLEPGLTAAHGRRLLVARGDWQRSGSTSMWGVGGAATFYAPDPRFRVTAGFEQRWSSVAPRSSTWALLRLTIAVD
jgi:hypothetical protein